MIAEDYVSFETAKLLKEKGFDGICRAGYTHCGSLSDIEVKEFLTNETCPDTYWECTAPTLQMTMKWLREVHHLIVLIRTGRMGEESSGHRFWFSIEDDDMKELADRKYQYDYCTDTYEQACEDAIMYCLENLV